MAIALCRMERRKRRRRFGLKDFHSGLPGPYRRSYELRGTYAACRKMTFEHPYQAIKIYELNELPDMLSKRAEFFSEEGEPCPVYINGEWIGELKSHENTVPIVRE